MVPKVVSDSGIDDFFFFNDALIEEQLVKLDFKNSYPQGTKETYAGSEFTNTNTEET